MIMVWVARVSKALLLIIVFMGLHGNAFALAESTANLESLKHPSLSEMIDRLNDKPLGKSFNLSGIEISYLTSLIENNNEALASVENLVSKIVNERNDGISPAGWAGIAGLILSVCKIVYDIWSKYAEKRSSKRDNFWLREVIFPKTIEPLDRAILNNEFRFKDFSKLDPNELQNFIDGFENLRDEVGLVTLLSSDLLKSIESAIDGLISVVANKAEPGGVYNEKLKDEEVIGDPFLICYKEIISHLISAHERKEHELVSG